MTFDANGATPKQPATAHGSNPPERPTPPAYSRESAAAMFGAAAPRASATVGAAGPSSYTGLPPAPRLGPSALGATAVSAAGPRPPIVRRPGAGAVYKGLPLPVRIVTWTLFLVVVGFVVGATAPTGLQRLGAVAALKPGLLAWYAVRTFGFLAYFVIAASVLYGLLLSTKILDSIAHRPVSFALHKDLAIVGMVLATLHALILIADQSFAFTPRAILVPFASPYSPVSVGIGQLTFYLSLVVTLSFYVRRQIGQRAWRLLHYATFLSFIGASYHGIMSGSDSGTFWAFWVYLIPVTAAVFLLAYRIVISVAGRARRSGADQALVPGRSAAPLGPLDRPGSGGILRRPS